MKKIVKILSSLFISFIFLFSNISFINAASGTINITSSSSKVVVGNTFNVTVKISSDISLGAWEWTISYDKNKLKLVSGEVNVVDVIEKENTKSQSYTYKFKAIGSGSSKITVKSYGAYDLNEKSISLSVSSKTINVITQAELEASYSKNNNLKSLSVDGLKLDADFNKDKLEYTTEADSNTEEIKINASCEDSQASVVGNGIQKVSEGENKFNITVTAENGSSKTYTLIVTVKDPNPIIVNIDNKELTVIKRESTLKTPEGFDKTTVELSNQKVPGFYNELNEFTLLGLKDKEGNIELYVYNKENNTYIKYTEVMMNDIKLFPLKMDKTFKETTTIAANILSAITKNFENDEYIKTTVEIDGIEFEALKQNKNSEYAIIHGRDLFTGKDNYYKYDSITNTVIRYDEMEIKNNNEKQNKYKTLILVLGIETIIVIFILICMLIKQVNNNKKRRKLYEELEKFKRQNELEELKNLRKKKKMIKKHEIKEEEETL